MYAVSYTLGDPPCVYGHCVSGQCACWPLVEGEACEIGALTFALQYIHQAFILKVQ